MWLKWTAGGTVTLMWNGSNHCRGIKLLEHTQQHVNVTHMHTHAVMWWCGAVRWYVVSGYLPRAFLTDTWHTYTPLSQPQCLLLKWGGGDVVDHDSADTSAVWFLSDFWRATCGCSRFSVLKLSVPCQWVILCCVYTLTTGKPLRFLKRNHPFSRS